MYGGTLIFMGLKGLQTLVKHPSSVFKQYTFPYFMIFLKFPDVPGMFQSVPARWRTAVRSRDSQI